MNLPEVLHYHPDGEIRFQGSRIGLQNVVALLEQGFSAEMISQEFDTISPQAIASVIAFWESNRPELDAYIAARRAEIERLRSELRVEGPNRTELLRRFEEKKRQAGAR